MIDVTAHSHFQCSCQCLEDALYLVVLILSFGFDVQIHLSGIAEALEEMQEHLRRHLANLLTVELCVPNQPGATTEVQAYGTETVVHRQGIAIALNASLVAQCSEQTLAQRQSSILNGVMLVNVQVAFHADGQIPTALFTIAKSWKHNSHVIN